MASSISQDTADPFETSPVMYEELAAIEQEFDDVDVEILRKQTVLQTPLYARRHALTSQIAHFWALVLEQASPDIETYIQPSDTEVLNTALTNIVVERFEVAGGPASGASGAAKANGHGIGTRVNMGEQEGDPRSILIRFEFAPNEWFEDDVLEKRFWYRRARDGWAGLVSEPVAITWKEGIDLTEGLGDAAGRLWEAEKALVGKGGDVKGKEGRKGLQEYTELLERLESSTPGAQSFFAWFAFRGRDVGAEESVVAKREERERRARVREGVDGDGKQGELKAVEEDESLEEDEDEYEHEVFPLGDELAISIAEDLWPGAIKYFTQAQEQDAISEADFEDDSADNDDGEDGEGPIPNLRGLVDAPGERAAVHEIADDGGNGEGPVSSLRGPVEPRGEGVARYGIADDGDEGHGPISNLQGGVEPRGEGAAGHGIADNEDDEDDEDDGEERRPTKRVKS